jgi:hypothetical protein
VGKRWLWPTLLLCACSERTLPIGDVSRLVDAGSDLSAACQPRARKAVAFDAIEFQPYWAAGRTVRARIILDLDPDDVLADVTLARAQGFDDLGMTDQVAITPHVWSRTPDQCSSGSQQFERVVVVTGAVPLPDYSILLYSAPCQGAGVYGPLPPVASTDCTPVALGGACELDCQCGHDDPEARCLPGTAGSLCGRSCSEDLDCPAARPHCHQAPIGFGVNHVCDADLEGCCAQGCRAGQSCQSCLCKIDRDSPPPTCNCDTDCGRGWLCSPSHRCFAPCVTTAGCPSGTTCVAGACQ